MEIMLFSHNRRNRINSNMRVSLPSKQFHQIMIRSERSATQRSVRLLKVWKEKFRLKFLKRGQQKMTQLEGVGNTQNSYLFIIVKDFNKSTQEIKEETILCRVLTIATPRKLCNKQKILQTWSKQLSFLLNTQLAVKVRGKEEVLYLFIVQTFQQLEE
jgi:hypothetical protein